MTNHDQITDTFHVVIAHPDGDTTVMDGCDRETMLSMVAMATMDPTLVVTVQRDDLDDAEVERIARVKAEMGV